MQKAEYKKSRDYWDNAGGFNHRDSWERREPIAFRYNPSHHPFASTRINLIMIFSAPESVLCKM